MDLEGLQAKAGEIADRLRSWEDIGVVYHYDADGICSGAIMCSALERLGKRYKALSVKQLYSDTLKEIAGLGERYLFVDFGSGQMELLVKEFGGSFAVIDHHQKGGEGKRGLELNPFDYGVDGGYEVSGAGLCYFVARELDPSNKRIAPLAVVGAVGDMQDSRGGLTGLTREVLEGAVKQGTMSVENDLALYGRISRPLIQFIMFSSSPVIPGLTANEENCVSFLNGLGIELKDGDLWRSYSDLSEGEKKRLVNGLVMHMGSQGVPERVIMQLMGEVYTLLDENPKSPLRDAKEYATLCNSCGRHGMAEVALAVCMGERGEGYDKALGLLAEHRRQLRRGIEYVQEHGVEDLGGFYFFDSGKEIKDSIVGIVAGMLYGSGQIGSDKPVVAIAEHEEGSLKVSARGTGELVRRGLNLGKALRDVCAELGEGAEGGGHKVAAGCKIMPGQRERFLELLGEAIKGQLVL